MASGNSGIRAWRPELHTVAVGAIAVVGVWAPLGVQGEMHLTVHAEARQWSDTCPTPAPRWWITDTVFAGLSRIDEPKELPNGYAAMLLEEIRTHWRRPAPFTMPAYDINGAGTFSVGGVAAGTRASGSVDQMVGRGTFALELALTLERDGSLRRLGLLTSSTSAELDASVVRAVRVADSARALPPPLGIVLHGDSLPLRLALGFRTISGRVERPFLITSLPVVGPLEPALPMPGNPTPWYPEMARHANIEGEVILQFVIDGSGHAVPGSYRILKATAREFARAVFDNMPNLRFQAARLAGCPVLQLVYQTFKFNLR